MSVTFRATDLSARPWMIEKRTAVARGPNSRMRDVLYPVVSLMKCAVDSQFVAG
jgi:hypothetical protein